MKKLTRAEAADFLAAHDHYIILTHNRPDGDTIGSAAALCRGLRSLGKTAHVLENKGVSPRFEWLHQGLTTRQVEESDCIVSVDVASPEILPQDFKPLLGRIRLRIDHHSSATSFTDFELVDSASASCAELVYDVLNLLNCPLDKDMAEAIYVGTSTDTGCFRYANTTAHTFSTAAACAQAGARIYQLNMELFETNTLARLKMQGWIVDNIKMLRNGSMCVCAIPKQVELDMGKLGKISLPLYVFAGDGAVQVLAGLGQSGSTVWVSNSFPLAGSQEQDDEADRLTVEAVLNMLQDDPEALSVGESETINGLSCRPFILKVPGAVLMEAMALKAPEGSSFTIDDTAFTIWIAEKDGMPVRLSADLASLFQYLLDIADAAYLPKLKLNSLPVTVDITGYNNVESLPLPTA